MGCIASSNHLPLVSAPEGCESKCRTQSPRNGEVKKDPSSIVNANRTIAKSDSARNDPAAVLGNKENVESHSEPFAAKKNLQAAVRLGNEPPPPGGSDEASPVLSKGLESEHQRLSNRRKSRFCDVQLAGLQKLELEDRGSEGSLGSQVDEVEPLIDPRKFDSVTNFTGISNANAGKVNMKSLYNAVPAREA